MTVRCAACGEPVSYADEGGCVGTDPAYHFKAECLLEAARRADAQLQEAASRIGELERENLELRSQVAAYQEHLREYGDPADDPTGRAGEAVAALQDVAARPCLTDADTRARVESARAWLTARGYSYPGRQ